MLTFFWTFFWAALTVLVLVAAVALRARIRNWLEEQGRPRVDDDTVRQILERGTVVSEEDEPLDLEEIEEEERRFWGESWDEPEEL